MGRGSTPKADVPPEPLHTKKGGKGDERCEEARALQPPPSEKQRDERCVVNALIKGEIEIHVWFEDRWMVASWCDE
jgi:hypothetical protein